MSPAWISLLMSAVETAIRVGKEMGLPTPGDDEIKKVVREINERMAKLLPMELDALNLYVQNSTARIEEMIASIKDDRCEKCGGVLTIHVDQQRGRWTSCDNCDPMRSGR